MDEILHLDAALDFTEPVLMMPEAVGTKSLFIDEQMWLDNMRDFRDPRARYCKERVQTIRDDHARVHFLGSCRGEFELQCRWCDLREILRIGEKFPGLVNGNGQELNLVNGFKLHTGILHSIGSLIVHQRRLFSTKK